MEQENLNEQKKPGVSSKIEVISSSRNENMVFESEEFQRMKEENEEAKKALERQRNLRTIRREEEIEGQHEAAFQDENMFFKQDLFVNQYSYYYH